MYKFTTFAEYYKILASGQSPEEVQTVVDLLTTNETYFFREPKHLAEAGTRPGEYQAKLLGGGNSMAIGSRNIECGRELLAANNINLVAEHVGGNGRRKLHLDLRSGHVWLAFPEGSNAYIRNSRE